ncbi:xanthine dehydrogenase small subunit [Sodalis sp. RH21]|uniref:xanthine dehydrogenase small subunit n=1 Tax=unclassified Sodalis (in: enterobacteria) TaxID=2636512 RepID=UPI0039B42CA7
MIRFLLNQTPVAEADLDPNTTLLTYLRRIRGRHGTKEGCASGDCGACTVVLAQAAAGKLQYRSVNACITLVSALHGKQLLTVEDLQQQGQLHGIQRAMVDCHASQCGFCTPGIIMSLFALQKSAADTRADASNNDEAITQALGGNLCRCTGYRSIVAAARQSCQDRSGDCFAARETETLTQLARLDPPPFADPGKFDGKGPACLIPRTLTQLSDAYRRHPAARLLAGGTDLALAITLRRESLPLLIDISHLPELKTLAADERQLTIGAGASLSACEPFLAQYLPGFADVLPRFASRQIRNQATLGGNLANASPVGDGAPMLLALDARLRLRQGEEVRELPLDLFFHAYRATALRPGEFIEQIIIPRVTASHIYHAYKVSKRREDDISAVFGAFNCEVRQGIIQSARLAYGGMAAIPLRAAGAEAALTGRPWGAEAFEHACLALAADFSPLSDLRASAHYRLRVAQNLLRRFYLASALPSERLEVGHYA